jgi:hypothetical protein
MEWRYAGLQIVEAGVGEEGFRIRAIFSIETRLLTLQLSTLVSRDDVTSSETMRDDVMVWRMVGTVCEAKCSIFEISSIHA